MDMVEEVIDILSHHVNPNLNILFYIEFGSCYGEYEERQIHRNVRSVLIYKRSKRIFNSTHLSSVISHEIIDLYPNADYNHYRCYLMDFDNDITIDYSDIPIETDNRITKLYESILNYLYKLDWE